MRYISVCSGIEAASVAWGYLGWEPVAFSEFEPFPCAVLKARYPGVPNLGDLTKIHIQPNGDIHYGTDAFISNDGRGIDVAIGGCPCQSFSNAGKREGLAGKSGLIIDYIRLVYELATYKGCRWFIYENVPGMLSSGNGDDFAVILSGFAGRDVAKPRDGWGNAGIVQNATDGNFGLAYRILDVQYTRVAGFPRAIPQRRRRVFLVGRLGSWERAAEVLFERDGLRGDTPPRRQKGKGASPDAVGGSGVPDGGEEGCPGNRGGRDGGALNPHDSQSERIYGTDGAFHAINANSGGGLSRDGILQDGEMAFFGETGQFAQKNETSVSATLRSSNGSEGPGTETLVVTNSNGGETAPTLTATDLAKQVTNEADSVGGTCLKQGTLGTARMTAFGEYDMEDGVASTAKARDFRGATDLIVTRENDD